MKKADHIGRLFFLEVYADSQVPKRICIGAAVSPFS